MKIFEMRIDCFNFDITADYTKYESFSIGHESCILKFFQIIQHPKFIDFLKEQKQCNKKIRILTPFVPQQYLSEMKVLLNRLLRNELFSQSVIIVNYLVMLYYIHQLDPQRRICLGRTLVFSFDFTPWGELIYANESQDIQEVIKQVNFYDNVKMMFYKRFNVMSLETNITQNTLDSLIKLKEAGFDIFINESLYLYGIQRSCYIRRLSPVCQCDHLKCDQIKEIFLASQWEECESFLNDTVKYFPSAIFLRGNQICGRSRLKGEHTFNSIISEEEYE